MSSTINDSILAVPTSIGRSESTIDDPTFSAIYNYIRDLPDFSPTATSSCNVADDVEQNTMDNYSNQSSYLEQHSRDVQPVINFQAIIENQTSTEEQIADQTTSPLQHDSLLSEKLQIKTQPRALFRPRTEKESKDSSHFLRCEHGVKPEYPTIYIPQKLTTRNDIIQVTLVDIYGQPHPYTIDTKEPTASSLVFKWNNEPHSLYFHLTEKDYEKGEKSFLIEYIKSKQEGEITKDLINERQLHQSMLRYTRFYLNADDHYQSDDASTVYSSTMTEHYGDFTIEDIFPLYGPMCGNQKVCIETKGTTGKDFKNNFSIIISCAEMQLSHRVQNWNKNGSNLTFRMPPFPPTDQSRAKVDLMIQYKQKIIYQTDYIYTKKLDEELIEQSGCESNIPATVEPSSSNNCNQRMNVFTAQPSAVASYGNHSAKRRKP
ncbi:unnamed protein product [Rotaria socialis]|uniref:Uncharacterized protein n=1 Tax=Rotaria socialis TaxID=392032 RepID=A0A821PZ68_9BILA|nr:unnamed protein product [Rotaria socialis]CAF3664783.1 unnamed protein product [Rotaria socialis]CAF4552477.1 unnamed protein product [Rotaria socialis]CAF4815164.1 unnamed protein product [Rotaria socialis]